MENNQLICERCGARFERQELLNEHELLHKELDVLNGTSLPVSNNEETDMVMYNCDRCSKSFKHTQSLKKHAKAEHDAAIFACEKCGGRFNYLSSKQRHEKTCTSQSQNHDCTQCGKRCSTPQGLKRHSLIHERCPKHKPTKKRPPENVPSVSHKKLKLHNRTAIFHCRRCSETFNNRHDLYVHGMSQHYQTGGSLQSSPWKENSAPWKQEDGKVDEELKQIYEANSPIILQPHRLGPIHSVYNYPVGNDVTIHQLVRYAGEIFGHQQHAFRLKIMFGVILQHRETGQYRYYTPFSNSAVLESPVYISKRLDLKRLELRLQRLDVTTELLRKRPDTKWVPVLVTNVQFDVTGSHYPIGGGELPTHLLSNDSIHPLIVNKQTGKRYSDNLCVFRCLALHNGYDIKSVDRPAKQFYTEWINANKQSSKKFEGVLLEQFPDFEQLFKVNLEVYSLGKDRHAHSIYNSRGLHKRSMYVNIYGNHLSYIKNFPMYARKFECKTCDRHFNKAFNLHRHQRKCVNQSKYVYPGGFYRSRDTVFEMLEQLDINIPRDERTFPWFVCYDFEAILKKVDNRPTDYLHWSHKHVPISVSISSNVPGYSTPFCIVESDEDKLVQYMVVALQEIASKVRELAEDKWGWALDKLQDSIKRFEEKENDLSKKDKDTAEWKKLKDLQVKFSEYMTQVPVLGYNSAKYDLNLIKRNLAKHLSMHQEKNTFVVKKENSYMCIASEHLKFLDISKFLAPGSSYSKFLTAYHVEERKGFFPYEWFDNVAKLDWTTLPPHESFYSTLKGTNISNEEYQFCQHTWEENNMSTFEDFLKWYNNLDVGPFVIAVERLQKFYFNKGLDIFKTAISVPGIARQLLFRCGNDNNASFALFDKKNADLYNTIKSNLVGGPSIIFTRYHNAGVTRIRGKRKCQAILGFDANGLYLHCIGKPLPVGPFVRRRAQKDFAPELSDKFMMAFHWLNWLIETEGLEIRHKQNHGSEVRVGKYPVDGYSPPSASVDRPTCYQFHGCFWHGHSCIVTRNVKDKKWLDSRDQKIKRTQEITNYLKERGCEVVEMYECQFREYCRLNPKIFEFINAKRPTFYRKYRGKVTDAHILQGVVDGELFGMVEVDIQVPHEWPHYLKHPSDMSPYQYFEEMSPLFCTSDIPFESIGEHMKTHVERHNLSKAPRRLLVGGMRGRKMLIATPLLRWYLQHGMVVTKIYQAIEFQQQRCFKDFVEDVTNCRREGDRNPSSAIIADTMRVIGNSAYGSMIMDKSKHTDILYLQGENETCLKVNEPRFRKLDCLDAVEQYYEVEMAKKKIRLDLPIQLGYFILQYAKLRMLEFYYDFMDVYVDRRDFEYMEMDTDSAYMAISGHCLADIIKPEKRLSYEKSLKGLCADQEMEADCVQRWFPRTCCSKHEHYDKRTPGLFKLEYTGEEMVGLCSKTYIVRKSVKVRASNARSTACKLLRMARGLKQKKIQPKERKSNEYKFTSKGVNKRAVKDPMNTFRSVLRTGKSKSGINRGFRVRQNTIYTYTQQRTGFSYFYCKRRILNDGIHTIPLDITLAPLSNDKQFVDDQ